jgi:hypothetical protein
MQDHPDLNDAEIPEYFERRILELILSAGEDRYTVAELGASVDHVIAALDAMSVLYDAGLIDRRGEYVFPTRAAIKVHELFATRW